MVHHFWDRHGQPVTIYIIVAIRNGVEVPVPYDAWIDKREAEKMIASLENDHPDYRDDGTKYVIQAMTVWTSVEERDRYRRRASEVLSS